MNNDIQGAAPYCLVHHSTMQTLWARIEAVMKLVQQTAPSDHLDVHDSTHGDFAAQLLTAITSAHEARVAAQFVDQMHGAVHQTLGDLQHDRATDLLRSVFPDGEVVL